MGGAVPGQERAPPLPRHGDQTRVDWPCVLLFIPMAGIMFGPFVYLFAIRGEPQYSVAITAASGLDGAPAAAAALGLDPVFNVTVRVTSRSGRGEDCLDPATVLQVSYVGVPLAGGHAGPGRHCTAKWRHDDQAVLARGEAVAVPGFLADSLAEGARSGAAVFEVALMRPCGSFWEVQTCWARVGDAAALETPCVGSLVGAVLPVPQPGSRRGTAIPAEAPKR